MGRSSTLIVFANSGLFCGLLLTVLGSQSIFHDWWTLRCAYWSVTNTRSFGWFLPVLWAIAHWLWVAEHFRQLMKHRVQLWVDHQHSQFWLILAHFVAYCSPFWCPRAISTVDKPRGAITVQSLRLRVLADSALFCGQFHIVLGSQNNFWSWSSIVAFLVDSGPVHVQLFTILRSQSNFMGDEPWGALIAKSPTLTVLADSCPFYGLLLIVLVPRTVLLSHQHSQYWPIEARYVG